MSEPRTALDLACEMGRIVAGAREWDLGFKWAREMRHYERFEHLSAALAAIPANAADAAEQIKRLTEEVARLAKEVVEIEVVADEVIARQPRTRRS